MMKDKKLNTTEEEIAEIVKELKAVRKKMGIGEDSYSTDGIVEKVTINGYTIWQKHGTWEKTLKEQCKKIAEDARDSI